MQEWVLKETQHTALPDQRLNKRLAKLLDSLSHTPDESIPNANRLWSDTIAAYRFLDNDRVTADAILAGHKAATLDRVKQEPVVLIAQDTTFLNFSTDSGAKEMGTLRAKKPHQQLLHVSLAISPARTTLGIVDASLWQRCERAPDESSLRGTAHTESRRWLDHYESACAVQSQCPDVTVISIADREGDIHEWFQLAQDTEVERRASYIIRAKSNRKLELEDGERRLLWDHLAAQRARGHYTLDVPQQGARAARKANIAVTYTEVQLCGRGPDKRPLFLQVVCARETHPPEGCKAVEWVLLTDLPVESFEHARMIIEWYRSRWEIEIYFRVLKGGCAVEANRLRTQARMFNCIAVYMIIAWRLHTVTRLAREKPDISCEHALSRTEWQMVWMMARQSKPPAEPPSMREMTRMLANLGGFLARKGDGEPGVKNIWRGYTKLLHYIEAVEMMATLGK